METRIDIFKYVDYRLALQDFDKRHKKVSRGWSHTIWSQRLGVKSPSTLSMILAGQRHPSTELARNLAKTIGLKERQQEYFSLLVELQKNKNSPEFAGLLMEKLSKFRAEREFHYIDLDQFSFMSNWYYSAIREMVHLRNFQEDALWISRHLKFKVSVTEVREAIRTLLRLKLLARSEHGRLIQAGGAADTPNNIPHDAIKRFHEQSLENAAAAVRLFTPEQRDFYSSVFVANRQQLDQARVLIRKFHDDLCGLLETKDGDTVFQLEVALFPLAGLKEENQ